MAKEIVETETENHLPAHQDPGHNAFEAHGAQATNRTIKGQILKFTKGFWKAGMENDEVDPKIQLIVDMRTLTVGWQKWENDKPVDNHMGLVSERFQAPSRRSIGDHDKEYWERDEVSGEPRDPWQSSNMVLLREMGTTGEDEGLFTFITSSRGGLSAVGVLSQRYGRKIREDDQALPVVELSKSSYKHSNKLYGEIYTPVLKVVGWATVDDVEDATETVMTPEQVASTPAPKTTPARAIEAPRKAAAASSKASTKVDPKAGKKKSTRF
jgi:hypothetical protein